MIESTAANLEQHFTDYLARVERGETIRISHEGRTVARMVPDFDFLPGAEAARFFEGHHADVEAADAVAHQLRILDMEAENALDR